MWVETEPTAILDISQRFYYIRIIDYPKLKADIKGIAKGE